MCCTAWNYSCKYRIAYLKVAKKINLKNYHQVPFYLQNSFQG